MSHHHSPSLNLRLNGCGIIHYIFCCKDQRDFEKKIKTKVYVLAQGCPTNPIFASEYVTADRSAPRVPENSVHDLHCYHFIAKIFSCFQNLHW